MDFLIIIIVVALIYYFLYRQNNRLDVTHYYIGADVERDVTVVQLSDLHTKSFGPKNEKLIDKVRELAPDIIVITGDILNHWDDRAPAFIDSLRGLTQLAPVYAIPGNHETTGGHWDNTRMMLREAGIRVLDNEFGIYSNTGARISILGLNESEEPDMDALFSRLDKMGGFRLVLSHYPLTFEDNVSRPFDLQLSGHAHGGQWRLPFIGGLYSPDQGMFPHYDAGIFENEGRKMIVSRGLGNSAFPLRLFNHPEIVCVHLNDVD